MRHARGSLALGLSFAVLCLTAEAQSLVEARAGSFRAIGVLSQDEDWQKRLFQPQDGGPQFTTPETLAPGQEARLLVLFTGAQVVDGQVDLECDLKIAEPGGRFAEAGPLACTQGLPVPVPDRVYPTALTVALTNGPEDVPGLVTVSVGVRDRASDVRLQLDLSLTRLPAP